MVVRWGGTAKRQWRFMRTVYKNELYWEGEFDAQQSGYVDVSKKAQLVKLYYQNGKSATTVLRSYRRVPTKSFFSQPVFQYKNFP